MMGLREFDIEGKKVTFNKVGFKQALKEKSKRQKISISVLEKTIAEKLCVAADTVHKWNYGKVGPGDYSMIVQIADILKIDMSYLLEFSNKGENDMIHFSDRQMAAIKRIYDRCIWFLHEFEITDGFNAYKPDFTDAGFSNPGAKVTERVDAMLWDVQLVLDQEYFDLHNCEIYDQLCDFVNIDLRDIYSEKLDYGSLDIIRSNYNKAMIHINTIIENCQ